jgi:hypothetical protein
MGCNSVENNVHVPKPTAPFPFFNFSGLVHELIHQDSFQRQILLFVRILYHGDVRKDSLEFDRGLLLRGLGPLVATCFHLANASSKNEYRQLSLDGSRYHYSYTAVPTNVAALQLYHPLRNCVKTFIDRLCYMKVYPSTRLRCSRRMMAGKESHK